MVRLALTAEQVCRLVKGTTTLDQSFCIEHIASLESAGSTDMAVVLGRGDQAVFTEVSLQAVINSPAAVILADRQLVPDRHFILVDDPLHAYTQLLQFVNQQAVGVQEHISSTARIAPDATLGDGVQVGDYVVIGAGAHIGSYARVGAHAVIEDGARVGDSAQIKPHVTIGARCQVGAHAVIHSGTVVGSDGFGYQATSTGMRKIPHIGIVAIGSHVEIGSNCSIDRATFDVTRIGDGVKIDNLVHIAHNVTVGPATAILAQTGIAGGVVIGAGCQIGGQVAIKDHVTIGDRARIVSKSAVSKNIAAGTTVAGIPATDFRMWKRSLAVLGRVVNERLNPATGSWWQRVAKTLSKVRR